MGNKVFLNDGYGARLHDARLALGYSQLRLARAALSLGASAKNIGRIERQEVTPTKETLMRICSVLNIDPAWLLYGINPDAGINTVLKVPGIGTRIREARVRKDFSQKALARMAGLGNSAQNVGRIEKALVNPRLGTVKRLSKVLGVPIAKLAYDL